MGILRFALPFLVALTLGAAAPQPPSADPGAFAGLRFRNLGPFRGGRVGAVTGVPGQPQLYYMGATGGGVWKTEDGGASWRNISDGFFKTGSVGAIAVSASDPNVIYVGMGEDTIRGNVSRGDGVYRSTDAGRTWTHVGLDDTQQITRVRVDPTNPDIAYVAALGHVWGPNEVRGIFRTEDGGKSWKKVLYVDDKTGASDLCMDPSNPRILYAAFWQVDRKPWTLESGGKGSGIYKSTDRGDTWKRLEGGLPTGILGRIGIAVSPARPDRVWALVEAEKGGLYRSEDGGAKWTRVNSENTLRQRAWYYSRIYADPKNADTVYALNVNFMRSQDGGRTFTAIPTPHGDNHDLWIAPEDPQRMIEGNDGGATVTVNGGVSWSTLMNQPTAQFYRVAVDTRDPYWIYGCQQDNTSVAIKSRAEGWGITAADWHAVGGGESGWIAPEPKDPDVVFAGEYGGQITRYDRRTDETRLVMPWPQLAIGMAPKDLKYRFQWNAPILISRFAPHALYFAAQNLLRSLDRGRTWEGISPDLTRNDKATQIASGGPITKDNTGVEVFGTIFALAESRQDPAILWAGSDDGLVHITRDGGKSWTDITPKGLPKDIQINSIDPSPFDAGTAYLAATAYKLEDLRPYLYRTNDFGKSWTRIDRGIPVGAFTRVVRADERRRGLLFAGTETGLYLSFDDGASWEPFQRNLPVVPITDLAVHAGDLIVATQGRAFWILDDLDSLRQWHPEVAAEPLHVFQPRPAIRADYGQAWWMDPEAKPRAIGQNPPTGAILDLWLKEAPDDKDPLTLEVFSGTELLRSFSSTKPGKHDGESAEKPLKLQAGFNRVTWDLRMFRPHLVPKAIIWGDTRGPEVAPGTYTLRVTYRGATVSRELVVRPRPGVTASEADLKAQADLLKAIRDRVTDIHQSVVQIRDVKAQVKGLLDRAEKLGKASPLKAPAKALTDKLDGLEARFVNPKLKSEQDPLNFTPALDHQFIGLAGVVGSGDAAPSPSSQAYYDQEKSVLTGLQAELGQVWTTELAAFDQAVQAAGIPPVIVVPAAK
jgi:photosystem II stability/assembly factor-like uncharacterized protein